MKIEDIILLPHPNSKTHKRMSEMNRAAQFAPFAALTGFDTAIYETARLTLEEKEICSDTLDILNQKLQILNSLNNNPIIKINYFQNDKYKKGGDLIRKIGIFLKIDKDTKEIIFLDKTKIKINKIKSLESSIFDKFNF